MGTAGSQQYAHLRASLDPMLKRSIVALHRWLGVTLCLLFSLWFPSGIGMMYWDFPSVTPADCLARSPSLDPEVIKLSPAEAAGQLDDPSATGDIRLNTFDGRPVYRFRSGRGEEIVYADSGERRRDVSFETMRRIAARWTGQPADAAKEESMTDVDQWTVQGELRTLRPLWKYSWPNGEQVYIAQATGEVVQYTTPGSRLGAYLGAIPHWLYFTPLRKHQPQWSAFVIWTSGIGTVGSILGLIVGIWMYSPAKRYRYAGAPTSIPYRGQKRLHTIAGLIFGIGAATWAFSGMLSMDPFPARRGAPGAAGRRGGGGIAQALHGRARPDAFTPRHPREALGLMPAAAVKELELMSFAGQPVYLATLAGGATRVLPMTGESRDAFDWNRIADVVRGQALTPGTRVEIELADRYDAYYLDRRHRKPLPVVLARMNDDDRTRFYIDPRTARVVGTYSTRNWTSRWLYHGLHSLDFPWLYDHRPLWDIVVITFMLGGTALSITSLILAWRVLGRKLAYRITMSEDLIAEQRG